MDAISAGWIDCREIYSFISFFPVAALSTSLVIGTVLFLTNYTLYEGTTSCSARSFRPGPALARSCRAKQHAPIPLQSPGRPVGNIKKKQPLGRPIRRRIPPTLPCNNDSASVSVQRASTAFKHAASTCQKHGRSAQKTRGTR